MSRYSAAALFGRGANSRLRGARQVEFMQPREITGEPRVGGSARPQAIEIGLHFRRTHPFRRQRIDHPVALAPGGDQATGLEVAEVLGNFYLRLAQYLLEMTDAERPMQQQVEQTQPRLVTQALVNLHEFHAATTFR